MSIVSQYVQMKREQFGFGLKKAWRMRMCYLFLLPHAVLFFTFFILPMCTSMYYSFTYYNILEPARFIGFSNYINLFLEDDIFLTAVKNTFVIAVVTGPLGYMLSFLFAWFINELPRWLRSIAVVVFYAPSIAGNAYAIFGIIFRGDAYGFLNAILSELGTIDQPIQWLSNPAYVMWVCVLAILWMSMGTGFLSFVAGLQGVDRAMYEAGYIDGVRNRWQELYYITLPSMKPMLLFGAIMSITSAFGVCDVTMSLAGFPSTDYCVRTVVTHLVDYGSVRFEMGYASAIAVFLFVVMILCKKLVQAALRKVGT